MNKFLTALLIGLISLGAQADDRQTPSHQSTSAIQGSRYELVQSQLAARWTFRLDRYTGRVYQLVLTKDDENHWDEMLVVGLPKGSAAKARFQMFTSGLAARHTFLLDTETGKTWTIVSGTIKRKDGGEQEFVSWQPFAD